jgi:hypothetical protein
MYDTSLSLPMSRVLLLPSARAAAAAVPNQHPEKFMNVKSFFPTLTSQYHHSASSTPICSGGSRWRRGRQLVGGVATLLGPLAAHIGRGGNGTGSEEEVDTMASFMVVLGLLGCD